MDDVGKRAVTLVRQRLYAQSQVRYPHAFQNSSSRHRHRLARARNWRDRWNLFSVHQVLLQSLAFPIPSDS